ncbi:MAG: EF-P lysine aminoacylase EpmA [Pseudohongiellaceae bacterium]
MSDWQPTASVDCLHQRAALLRQVREFFCERGVLEVETPVLSRAASTDIHLQSIKTAGVIGAAPYFLHTSPEFAMKRLLAAGIGPIFQVCKVFRGDERSHRHNPEFTMLEWYRPGYDEQRLMDEVEDLVTQVLGNRDTQRLSYRELFKRYVNVDPHTCPLEQLRVTATARVDFSGEQPGRENPYSNNYDRDDYLQLLLTHVIEPAMPPFCFVYDYPRSQAALARLEVDDYGCRVARRFELFVNGLEIANGYYELTDPEEQRERFAGDQRRRRQQGKDVNPLDERLLAAMESGLESCAGVALGMDRLLMAAVGASSIDEVLSFPAERS